MTPVVFVASVPRPADGTILLIVQAPDAAAPSAPESRYVPDIEFLILLCALPDARAAHSATNTAHDGINGALLGHHIGTSVEQPEPRIARWCHCPSKRWLPLFLYSGHAGALRTARMTSDSGQASSSGASAKIWVQRSPYCYASLTELLVCWAVQLVGVAEQRHRPVGRAQRLGFGRTGRGSPSPETTQSGFRRRNGHVRRAH
jgi:hypothetical protein